ncbi:MAG: hypothetical protein ACLUEV_00990 [Alistipes sp.]
MQESADVAAAGGDAAWPNVTGRRPHNVRCRCCSRINLLTAVDASLRTATNQRLHVELVYETLRTRSKK